MATIDNITFEILQDSATQTGYPDKAKIEYGSFSEEVLQADIESVLNTFLGSQGLTKTAQEFVDEVRASLIASNNKSKKEKLKKIVVKTVSVLGIGAVLACCIINR